MSVSLNYNGKDLSAIINVVSFVNIFQFDFSVASVWTNISVWFSVSKFYTAFILHHRRTVQRINIQCTKSFTIILHKKTVQVLRFY